MRLPKYLNTVTVLSKTLALMLFIALPFIGFYYGRIYQKSLDNYLKPQTGDYQTKLSNSPKQNTSLNIEDWKEFKDPSGKFAINFPQNWLISFEQSPRYKDKMDIKLEGPEGQADIMWADSYGGGCDKPGYEKIMIKSGEEMVCHTFHIQGSGHLKNAEFWQIQNPFKENSSEGIYLNGYAYDNSQDSSNFNHEVLLKIIQSLKITP